MFVMIMQMSPELMSTMGGGHRQITREIERIEKYKELKVSLISKRVATVQGNVRED